MKFIHSLLLMIVVSANYSATVADEPAYLAYRSDFVQQVYSSVLIGFAFERKCNFLTKSDQANYEEQLNFSTEIFQGYVLAKEMVRNSDEALSYPRDMALGTKRFSDKSICDSVAEKRVHLGFETAKNFMSLIERELRKEVGQ
jgi:hypothetical protein